MAAARCSCCDTCRSLRILADDARRAAPLGELLLQQDVLGQHPALRDRALDHQQQMIGIDGLGQEVHRPFLHRGHRVLDAAIGGHHDDLQLGVELLGRAKDAEAVADGKLQVGEDDAPDEPAAAAARPRLVARLEHGVALRFERMAQHGAERILVFDDENGE